MAGTLRIVGWLVSILRGKRLYVTSHGTDIVLLRKNGLLRLLADDIPASDQSIRSLELSEGSGNLILTSLRRRSSMSAQCRRASISSAVNQLRDAHTPLILSVARFDRAETSFMC